MSHRTLRVFFVGVMTDKSSVAFGATSAVAPHCNLARFRPALLSRDLEARSSDADSAPADATDPPTRPDPGLHSGPATGAVSDAPPPSSLRPATPSNRHRSPPDTAALHAQLPHAGSVTDQPKQLSRIQPKHCHASAEDEMSRIRRGSTSELCPHQGSNLGPAD